MMLESVLEFFDCLKNLIQNFFSHFFSFFSLSLSLLLFYCLRFGSQMADSSAASNGNDRITLEDNVRVLSEKVKTMKMTKVSFLECLKL